MRKIKALDYMINKNNMLLYCIDKACVSCYDTECICKTIILLRLNCWLKDLPFQVAETLAIIPLTAYKDKHPQNTLQSTHPDHSIKTCTKMLTVSIWKPQRSHSGTQQRSLQPTYRDLHKPQHNPELHNSDFKSITNLRDLLKSGNLAFTPTQQTCY